MSRPRGTGRIYLQKRSSMWWIQYYRKGVMYRESTRTSDKGKATRLLILRLAAVSEETILEAEFERVRVAELAEDFFREARNNGMPAVDAEARWRLHLEPFFGRFEPGKSPTIGWMNTSTSDSNREQRTLRSIANLEY